MLVERKHPITKQEISREFDITQDQFDRWQSGELIQNAMPNLTPGEREWLISGFSEEEWEEMFGE